MNNILSSSNSSNRGRMSSSNFYNVPNQTVLNQTVPNQTVPNQIIPNQPVLNQYSPEQLGSDPIKGLDYFCKNSKSSKTNTNTNANPNHNPSKSDDIHIVGHSQWIKSLLKLYDKQILKGKEYKKIKNQNIYTV